jgi:hypothetical protein
MRTIAQSRGLCDAINSMDVSLLRKSINMKLRAPHPAIVATFLLAVALAIGIVNYLLTAPVIG